MYVCMYIIQNIETCHMPYFKKTCSLNFKSQRSFQFILKTQMLSEVLLFQLFDVKYFMSTYH